MNIYTGTGDAGTTFNLNGKEVSKNDASIHFLGALDELNSHLGLVKTFFSNEDLTLERKPFRLFIEEIQKNLMKIMSNVSAEGGYSFTDAGIDLLEKEIDRLSDNIPRLNELVIPGKNVIEAQIHIARTAARKAERLYAAMIDTQQQTGFTANLKICAYLNRLSDYLFVLSQQSGTGTGEQGLGNGVVV